MKQRCGMGAFFLLIAWAFGVLMTIFVKIVYPMTNVWIILSSQNIVSLLCTLPWYWKYHKAIRTFSSWKLIVIRTIAGFISFLFLFMGIHHTELANAVLMNSTAPIFVPLVALIWLGIRIHPKLWWGIALGFIGIVLILRPTSSILKEVGVLYALISGISFAIVQVALRQMAEKEHPIPVLFYYFLFGSLVSLAPTITFWKALDGSSLVLLAAVGLSMFLFQFFIIKAFTYAPPTKIAPINYAGIVYSAFAGWFLWQQTIQWTGWVGIGCIILGGVFTLYIDKQIMKKGAS